MIEPVIATIARQTDDDWAAPFLRRARKRILEPVYGAFLACAGRLSSRGQMIYLQREVLGL